jgi:2-hydroxy-3-oxopropionate reductase
MVPDTPHVQAVLFGEKGVAEGLSPGKIVVDMSSISPIATKEFAQKINALGCQYLDAPVSGGEVGPRRLRSPSWSAVRNRLSMTSSRCSS